jgi:hypothetical protein
MVLADLGKMERWMVGVWKYNKGENQEIVWDVENLCRNEWT